MKISWMKDFANDFWCPYWIHQIMDGSAHWGCWEVSRYACHICWVWCINKRPWLQFVVPRHHVQYCVQNPSELHKERWEWGWEPSVAAVPRRNRLHGWWVCNCSIKISVNIKSHFPSFYAACNLQFHVFLEMQMGLQEEECLGDIPLPRWFVKVLELSHKKDPSYHNNMNLFVPPKTWIFTKIYNFSGCLMNSAPPMIKGLLNFTELSAPWILTYFHW